MPLAGGTMTGTGSIDTPDQFKLRFGAGNDFQIYHQGGTSGSYIDNYSGNMRFNNYGNDTDIVFNNDDGTGATATYFFLDGSKADGTGNLYTNFPDKSHLTFGTKPNGDLQIYHDGSHSYINDAGTGNLEIRSNFLKVKSPTAEDMIWAQEDAGVTLFYNNVAKTYNNKHRG